MPLEGFDPFPVDRPAAVRELLTGDSGSADLRRLQRLLQPRRRLDPLHGGATVFAGVRLGVDASADEPPMIHASAAHGLLPPAVRSTSSGGLSLLLATGIGLFVVGVIALGLSLTLVHTAAWQFGVAATIAGEGVLLLAVAAISARLWSRSGRMSRQLDGVDRQLGQLRAATHRVDGAERSERACFPLLDVV